ncbi:NifB/NifX family molybdenum-iron cluster-binding protein [Desulfovibrio sp. OttesenSCG-928-A18]|nr:NifB/NifX family molybdenum-iron cluster-binding protein [Desulfovibrio sp. OttesenSCG-928-A18]
MPVKYALLTICGNEIAPRFDMTAEVLIAPLEPMADGGGEDAERRQLVLAHVSGEELCDVITRAGVNVVVCCGIEEDYYHYLRWKRIEVISDVMGPCEDVLARLAQGALQAGDCLYASP